MKLYLDNCCLNRPFDDQGQDRIRLEADAVRLVLELCQRGLHQWFISETTELEFSRLSDEARRLAIGDLIRLAAGKLVVDEESRLLASGYVKDGLRPMDALHLAVATAGGCDILFDDGRSFDQRCGPCQRSIDPR